MKNNLLFSLLIITVVNVNAQKLTTGIYSSPTSDASTYVELVNDSLKTVWSSKYPTNYYRVDATTFKSDRGDKIITIESIESYKVTNVNDGNSTTLTLQLALPKLDAKDLEEIVLPGGGKAFITKKLPFEITGNYKFDGSANVATQLNADGTGQYQYATDSNTPGTLFNVKWGILCNDAGQHLANSFKGINSYTLMIYTTKWEGVGVQYNAANGRVVINRDRLKM